MKLFKISIIFFVGIVTLFSCNKQPVFTVTGEISGLQTDTLYIYFEKRDFSNTILLDSMQLGKDGIFNFEIPSPEYPDLYILRLGNQSINLSVDSVETIVVNASFNSFAIDYSIEGSEGSLKMKEVLLLRSGLQKDINVLKEAFLKGSVSSSEFQTELSELVEVYKTKVKSIIFSNTKSPAAYFALFQKIDDILILNPYERDDSRVYSAVATAWDTYYKETSRAEYLRDFTINAIKERKAQEQRESQIQNLKITEANSQYFNIVLPDINDKTISLESLKGKVVLLDFTTYQAEYSPLHSKNIYDVYQRHSNNMEVYQVSFDSDVHLWKNAAANLPWVCVYENKGAGSELVKRFNIQQLPTTYLINRRGELVKKLDVGDNIETEIKKLF